MSTISCRRMAWTTGLGERTPNLKKDLPTMKTRSMLIIATTAVVLAVVGAIARSAQDKYTLQVPNGLAFSEFRDTKTGRSFPSVRPESCSRRWSPIPQ